MVTGKPTIDKSIGRGLIVTLLLQIIAFTGFLVRLDSRIENLEVRREKGDRFTQQDGLLLEQKIEFYSEVVLELKTDIKGLDNKIDELKESILSQK